QRRDGRREPGVLRAVLLQLADQHEQRDADGGMEQRADHALAFDVAEYDVDERDRKRRRPARAQAEGEARVLVEAATREKAVVVENDGIRDKREVKRASEDGNDAERNRALPIRDAETPHSAKLSAGARHPRLAKVPAGGLARRAAGLSLRGLEPIGRHA